MNQLELDNHANQLNPNNENYQGTTDIVVDVIVSIILGVIVSFILSLIKRN